MFTKSFVRTKAAGVKTTVDEVHAALDALPAGPEADAAKAAFDKLHRRLNWVSRKLADIFDDDIETFSGGNDRPDEEP